MFDYKPTLQQARELVKNLFQKNRYEKIIQDYLEEAAANPDDMRIRLKIAETYFKAKNIEKAIEVYQEIARVYIEQNFILKAISIYKNILKLDPRLVEINLNLAKLYLKLEMLSDAVNQYKIAIKIFESEDRNQEVVNTCKELIQIDPSPLHQRKLAETYQAQGMIDEAVKQFEALAQIYRTQKQYDELLRVYELILPHKSTNLSIIKDVCILYLRRQEPDHAIKTMERFKVDAEPGFAELYEKARLMKKALKGGPKATPPPPSE